MPLSEHEQRLLDQMERALYEEDPSFATQMKSSRASANRGRILTGALVALAGLAVVIVGVNAASIPLGVLGFVVLVGGIVWAVTPAGAVAGPAAPRRVAGPAAGRSPKGPRAPKSASFMERLDDRWEKRRREDGF